MLNRELITTDGEIIYPEFIGQKGREELYRKYGDRTHYMRCCCRPDAELYYRVSKDFRIYPEHQGYIHDPYCIFALRTDDSEKLGYDIDAENGEINVNFKFKINSFTPPQDKAGGAKDTKEPVDKDGKFDDFKLSLPDFIHDLFADVFNERASEGKAVLSSDYFLSSVYARLKRVYVGGLRKSLRDCTLEDDKFQFFMFKFHGFTINKDDERETYFLNVVAKDGKEYKWFLYSKLYDRVAREFHKAYGLTLSDVGEENVYVAGFRYKVRKYRKTETYNAVGRLTVFIVNDNGLHCRNIVEKINLNALLKAARYANGKYFVGGTDDFYDGYFVSDTGQKVILCGNAPKGLNKDYRVVEYDITRNTLSNSEIKSLLLQNTIQQK